MTSELDVRNTSKTIGKCTDCQSPLASQQSSSPSPSLSLELHRPSSPIISSFVSVKTRLGLAAQTHDKLLSFREAPLFGTTLLYGRRVVVWHRCESDLTTCCVVLILTANIYKKKTPRMDEVGWESNTSLSQPTNAVSNFPF